jgi:ABC-type transporter MlaC component
MKFVLNIIYFKAMINMLQGRESEQQRKKAYQMSSQEREKRLKVLRNQQTSWSQSNSNDTKHLHQILMEGINYL